MNRVLAILAMLVPLVADAKPPLVVHEFGDISRHTADGHGASNRRHDVSIAIELRADHKLSVIAKGSRTDHELNETSNTDETVTWTTTWRGTWAGDGNAITLHLALVTDTCSGKSVTDAQPATAIPCRSASRIAELACSTTSVEIGLPDAASHHVDAWQCSAKPDLYNLGESPATWVTGKTTCIDTVDAALGNDRTFRACKS